MYVTGGGNNQYIWSNCNFSYNSGVLLLWFGTEGVGCVAAHNAGGGIFFRIPARLLFQVGSNISFQGNKASSIGSGNSIFSAGTRLTWTGFCPLVSNAPSTHTFWGGGMMAA